jgi:hypothetical protein
MQYLTGTDLAGERGCIPSDCGTYRYLLTRPAEPMRPMKSTALFVGRSDDSSLSRFREAMGLQWPRHREPVRASLDRSGRTLVAS